jgi:uncharacterized integral membrane protein
MIKIIFNMIIVTAIIIFALFNQDDMVLNIVNLYEIILPKFFVVIVAFVLGFVAAMLVFSVKLFGLRMKLRNLGNKYKSAETKLNNAGISHLPVRNKFLKFIKPNAR